MLGDDIALCIAGTLTISTLCVMVTSYLLHSTGNQFLQLNQTYNLMKGPIGFNNATIHGIKGL